jgi:hypothetical protein
VFCRRRLGRRFSTATQPRASLRLLRVPLAPPVRPFRVPHLSTVPSLARHYPGRRPLPHRLCKTTSRRLPRIVHDPSARSATSPVVYDGVRSHSLPIQRPFTGLLAASGLSRQSTPIQPPHSDKRHDVDIRGALPDRLRVKMAIALSDRIRTILYPCSVSHDSSSGRRCRATRTPINPD